MKSKRIYFLAAAAILAAAVVISSIAGRVISQNSSENKIVRIATPMSESSDRITFQVLSRNLRKLESVAEVEFMFDSRSGYGSSNDGIVYMAEDSIKNGAEAIMLCPPSDEVLPVICHLCEEAGVYWGIYFRSIADEDIRGLCEASEYYVGNIYEQEKQMAYRLAVEAYKKGYRHLALLSEASWDTTCQSREKGIQEALSVCPEMEVLTTVRDIGDKKDAAEAVRSLIKAYPQLDCIYLVGTKASLIPETIIKTIKGEGMEEQIKLVMIDFSDNLSEDFRNGILTAAYGLPQLSFDPYLLSIKLINAAKGYPLEKQSTSHYIQGHLIDKQERAEELAEVIENKNYEFFKPEYIRNTLLKWNNPQLDGEEFQRIIDEYAG